MQNQKYKVLLFYKYVPLEYPKKVRDWQFDLCKELDITGRILIAEEGINGTISGLPNKINEYISATTADERFSDIEWKISYANEHTFPKIKVTVRPEIVTLGLKIKSQDVSLTNKAHYIEPEELVDLYDKNEDFVILDARNIYEAKIGKFKNALVPPIDNFRDFPEFVKNNLNEYKNKPVVTYCTGGIRCEKASAYLREKGFEDVRQLHGGVHVYAEKTGGKHFEGELFVFDKRLHIDVNQVNPEIISSCEHCGIKIARYIDCEKREKCKGLFICCLDCEEKHQSLCTKCEPQIEKLSSNSNQKFAQ